MRKGYTAKRLRQERALERLKLQALKYAVFLEDNPRHDKTKLKLVIARTTIENTEANLHQHA